MQLIWGRLPPSYRTYDSWYEYKGGSDAYQNPGKCTRKSFYCKQRLIYIYVTILRYSNIFKIPIDETDPTGIAHEVLGEMSARLMPGSVVRNNPEDIRSLIFTLVGHMGPI